MNFDLPGVQTDTVSSQPFFYAARVNGEVRTQGQASCFLGHRLKGGDGVYAAWQWDGTALTIQNDKHGFYPLYYYHKDHAIGVSPSIVKLLELVSYKDFDYRALSIFIRLGFFLREDTPFKYIRALPPSVDFRYENGRLAVSGHYTIEKPLTMKREDALDAFASLFTAAMKKRLPVSDDFVVPISGGKDSRRILLELNALGLKPKMCVTHHQYPPRTDEDVRIAKMLTGALGIKHVILDQPAARFENELRKNLITGFCSDEHVHTLVMADYLKGKTTTIYDGIGGLIVGSFLMAPTQAQMYEERQYSALAQTLVDQWGLDEPLIKKIISGDAYKLLNPEGALETIVEELKIHAQAPNPITSFHFYNRTRREIALIPYTLLGDIPYVYSPYLDHDLCRFFFALPPDIFTDGMFHSDAARRSYPQYAHIPYETKKHAAVDSPGYFTSFAKDFIRYYLRTGSFRSRFIRREFLLPRIAKCFLNQAYHREFSWVPFSFVLGLLQLENMSKNIS